MGKWTDKLFITAKEWQEDFGGKKEDIEKKKYKKLPFDCCFLTLQPFKHPCCTIEGHIFELENIHEFIKKHHMNPVTGEKLEISDLIPLKMHKNHKGEWHCPVTFKVFTDFIHIVAIQPSGQVYAYDAIEELNLKTKNYKDLMTDVPFKKSDIITLQDPQRPELRNISSFHHLKFIQVQEKEQKVEKTGMTKRILKDLEKSAIQPVPKLQNSFEAKGQNLKNDYKKPENARPFTTGRVAASFTSTSLAPVTINEYELEDVQQTMYQKITEKGYAEVNTNFGSFKIELYCDMVPKTCHNFIGLAKKGYYNNVLFHRLIPGFMIQGGDPTGTGRGGESLWKTPFEDEFHSKLTHHTRGLLSMANAGKDTNRSQFFITFASCRHLDRKHSIFGKIIENLDILNLFEKVSTDASDRPEQEIKIESVIVVSDPFEKYLKSQKEEKSEEPEQQTKKSIFQPVREGVGKYMQPQVKTVHASSSSSTGSNSALASSSSALHASKKQKIMKKGQFGDFSSW